MEQLPLEMVEKISSHLTAQELAACCAVNKTWRDIFNYDTLWQQRCRSSCVKNLKTEDCKVNPKFVSPEEEVCSLSLVGEWRMNFMKENHLWNNWRTGKWVQERISENSGLYFVCCFLTNNLVLWINFENKAQLLDVSVSPFLNKGEPFKLLKGFHERDDVLCCERFGELKCVIIQESVVMIYNIGSPVRSVWELEHVFITHEKEKIDLSKAKEYAENKMGDMPYFQVAIIGNKLVACSTGHVIHIWDIDSGNKLKEETFFGDKSVRSLTFKRAENELPYCVVAVECNDSDSYHLGDCSTYRCYIYSLHSLNFLSFNVEFKYQMSGWYNFKCIADRCAIINEVFAVFIEQYLRIYKFKTSELLFKISSSSSFEVLEKRIFFESENRIKVFNVASESIEILSPFKTDKRVLRFELVVNKFLLVRKTNKKEQVWETHKMNNKTSSNISKLTLLNSLGKISDLGVRFKDYRFQKVVNECCSRMIFHDSHMAIDWLEVRSFW